jgi:hypothetical protein
MQFLPVQGLETGLTGVIVGLTGSSISDSTFLGLQVRHSAIVPPEEDKAELQVLKGHNLG